MVSKVKKSGTNGVVKRKVKNDAMRTVIVVVSIMAVVTVGVNAMQVLKTKMPQVEVIVAVQNIDANTVVDASMLKKDTRFTDDVLKLNVKENLAVSAEEIVGKRTCAPIYAGEIINKHRIVDNTSAMKQNWNNLREVSLSYSSTDLGLHMGKGDFIDLWKVPTPEGTSSGYLPEKILSNVEIISLSTSDGFDITGYSPAELTADTYLAPGFYTVFLDETQLQNLYGVDTKNFYIKSAAHTENTAYQDVLANQKKLEGTTPNQEPDPNQNVNTEGEPVTPAGTEGE